MDRRSWLWRRKSSEKSPGETESSGSVSSISERYSDDQEALRASPVNSSPNNAQSPEVTSKIVNHEVHETVKSLNEKLSAALFSLSAKEDLVKQHAVVAEEAVAGWENAENEVASMKQQLEATSKKNSALEDRIGHLDGALKECVRQLRQSREDQEQKLHDTLIMKANEWESQKFELETRVIELQAQLEARKAEVTISIDYDLQLKLQAFEKENSTLKAKLLAAFEDLQINTLERELSTRAAETASKQHLESIKKVVKLEAECRRLRAAAKRSSPFKDNKHLSFCVEKLFSIYLPPLVPDSQLKLAMCKNLHIILLIAFTIATATPISADPPGFLSLSCSALAPFTDSSNISWTPDSSYIATGNVTLVDSISLRYFPNSDPRTRICYKLPLPANVSSVLLRSSFVYKNYDGLGSPPAFAVSLGTATATVVNLTKTDPLVEEFVWSVYDDRNTLPFCLHSVAGGGFPVIASLEVRPLPAGAYGSSYDDSERNLLRKRYRISCGYTGNASLRYPFDYYDRVWDVDQNFWPSRLSTGFKISVPVNLSGVKESPPVEALQTARVLVRRDVLTYFFSLYKLGDYYVILYFAGIMPVSPTFDVVINGNVVSSNYSVKHGEASSIFFTGKGIDSLNIAFRNISFYPQVNAIEIYEIIGIPMECSTTTVSALQVIQQSTGFDLGWQDDPCSPTPWKHIGCHGNLVTSLELPNMELRVISPTFGDLLDLNILDLHNTSLGGEIVNLGSLQKLEILNLSLNKITSFGSDFGTMFSLQILDLQNNRLEGTVPEILGSLKNLHLLNLENNKLRGALPQSLNKETLEVRTSGNLCLSFSLATCNRVADHPTVEIPHVTIFNVTKPSGHGHRRSRPIILAAIGSVCFAVLLLAIGIFMYRKWRKRNDLTSTTSREIKSWNASRVFTYKEIKAATNNFKDVIGTGGFGSIYLGKLSDGKLVAVKVRFDKTQLGADSFINEVHILSQVRHQNLVQLEGFCYESKQQILVYEYLPGGSLADNLYGSNSKKATLNWARRLKIAVDAAKGLDYLHNGSNPRIIHRDVKCSNILLDSDMNAKVGDFGLSKQVPLADATHVTTTVKGTAGYLDPEYYATQQLTEKSDVYSFGVVLLELICGREPLSHAGNPDSYNLVLWAKPYLQAGASEIVDDSLRGGFDVESMRKAASIAVRSVERDASERPTMAEVLTELKEAYSIQLTSLSSGGHLS